MSKDLFSHISSYLSEVLLKILVLIRGLLSKGFLFGFSDLDLILQAFSTNV